LVLFAITLNAQTINRSIVNKYKKANKFELIEVIHQKWKNNDWVNTAKDVYTYNEKGIRVTEETFKMKQGSWAPVQQTHFRFGENDRRIEKKVENMVDGKWIPVKSVATTYNNKGQKTGIEYFAWIENHWTRVNKYVIEYNLAGKESIHWWKKWNRTTNSYLPKSKYTFFYSGTMRTGSLHEQFIDGSWVNSGQSKFGNFEGYQTVHQKWNGQWNNERRDQYVTNENGKYILKVVQRWHNGTWVNSAMHVYSHDDNQNIKQEIVQHFDVADFQNENKYIWIYSRGTESSKSELVSAEAEPWHIVYPNPFSFETTIRFANPEARPYNLEITDLEGRLVKKVVDIKTERYTIKRASMPAGVYIYRLLGDHEFKGRMVVQD